MEYQAALLHQCPADQRERIAGAAFAAAAREHPLFGHGSHRYYECYFDHQQEPLDVVVLRASEPVLFMPLSGAGGRVSYFGEPARIFGVSTNVAADEAAYAALRSMLTRELGQRYASLWMVEDGRLGCGISSRVQNEIAMVDLGRPEAAIRSDLRKSYKSLVNWGLRSMQFRVVNRENPDAAAFRKFRAFHRQVAKRVTRSDQSWDLQFEMIHAGEAFAILGELDGQLVAATLVIHSGTAAYYGVGVYDRTLMTEGKPIGHASVFRAIVEARALGLNNFILGDVTKRAEPKADGISIFKRGFATRIVAEKHALVQLN